MASGGTRPAGFVFNSEEKEQEQQVKHLLPSLFIGVLLTHQVHPDQAGDQDGQVDLSDNSL